MTARDELARVVYIAGSPSTEADSQYDWNYLQSRTLQAKERVLAVQYRIADALISAGYRKPRTITTAEELDELPFKSVVMDHHGTVYHRWLRAGWQSAGPTLGSYRITLPATVLHVPEVVA